jgi:redox-sensing transcriptional repressor
VPLSDPAVGRLPLYQAIASEAVRRGERYISSATIAGELGLRPVLVRSLESSLAWGGLNKACLIGAGRLGAALLANPRFASYGLAIVAAFDNDPGKIGVTISGRVVQPPAQLPAVVRGQGALIAILAVLPEAAQEAADLALLSKKLAEAARRPAQALRFRQP